MSKLTGSGSRQRRQRSEARHSITAILQAAVHVLGERPDAGMAEVATAAGLTRQTVYAHFPSRQALLDAALDQIAAEAIAAMDAADLDDGPPADALIRFLQAGWQTFERYPLLAQQTSTDPHADQHRHQPVLARLQRLIIRGQASGDFTTGLPATWLMAATIALGHTTADQVATGQLTPQQATNALDHSLLRLYSNST